MVLNKTWLFAIVMSLMFSSAASAQQSRPRPLLYGFALECVDCADGGHARSGGPGRGASPGVTYKSYPHVIAVAPGSAAERAGILPGDMLREIDGLSLLTKQGTDRFAGVSAGDKVRLGFERNAKPMMVTLTIGRSSLAGTAKEMNIGYMSIQGAKMHGDLKLDFWSDEPIYTVPDSANGTITFQIGQGTIIRLKYTKIADSVRKQ